jgi:hypothetical protein
MRTSVPIALMASEIVEASRWMQDLTQSYECNVTLPDASLVWSRARLFEKQGEANKAQDIFEWAEVLYATVISLSVAAWLAWNWYAILGLISWSVAGMQSWLAFGSASILTLSVAGVFGLVALALTYPLLMDE